MSQNQSLPEAGQDYKNNHINVSVSRLPGSMVKLNVTVMPEAVDAAYTKAVKNVSKEVSLPGFRKGKAPDDVIAKKFEKPIIQEWQKLILQVGYGEALELTRLQPYRQNSVRCTQMSDLKKNNQATFVIEFEAGPQVPTINLDQLSLPKLGLPPITNADVEQVITNIKLYNAKWEDVVDRGIQEGDYVDLDIENLDENINICKDTRFEVKPLIMSDWMIKLLRGKKVGEETEGTSQKEDRPLQPDEEEVPDFKPTKVKMTVKAIKKPTLPEINEEFLKRTGATSLEDLESKVKADLERRAQQKLHFQLVRLIDEQLIDQYHFEVPVSLIQAEVNQRMMAQRDWMRQQNAPEEEVQKMLPQIEKELPIEVEKGCRLLFLLLGFAQQHKMSVTQEEIIQELTQQVAYNPAQLDELKDPNAVKARMTQALLLRKAKDYIVDYVTKKG